MAKTVNCSVSGRLCILFVFSFLCELWDILYELWDISQLDTLYLGRVANRLNFIATRITLNQHIMVFHEILLLLTLGMSLEKGYPSWVLILLHGCQISCCTKGCEESSSSEITL